MSAMTDETLTLDEIDTALRNAWITGPRAQAYIDRLLDLRLTLS